MSNWGAPAQPCRKSALAVPMEEAGPALSAAALVKAASPGQLICHVDAREADIASALTNYRRLGEVTGADIVLEILLPGKESPESELARVAAAARGAGAQAGRRVRFARCGSEGGAARQQGPRCAGTGRYLSRGTRRIPRRQARRWHVLLLHRAEPQAAAGGTARFRHPYHQPDRSCRRRCLGDGDAGSASLCDQIGQGDHRQESLSRRPQRHTGAPEPLWRCFRAQSEQ